MRGLVSKRVVSAVVVAGVSLATVAAPAHGRGPEVVVPGSLGNARGAPVVSAATATGAGSAAVSEPTAPADADGTGSASAETSNDTGASATSSTPPTNTAASATSGTTPTNTGASATSGVTSTPKAAHAAADHPTQVPEPGGYWTGPANSPVPATLAGAKVITSAHRLQALLDQKHPALIDVSNAPRRPDNLAPGAPWLPLPHRAIPGTLWIPGPGAGAIPDPIDAFFRQQLAKATDNDPPRPVIIYCHKSCWLSWNAAKRAVAYGYQHVYWYRDGIEGWKAAGLPTAVIEPRLAPEG
jgi:PQQ-dependent catabolism-associated CXXCW motif protein